MVQAQNTRSLTEAVFLAPCTEYPFAMDRAEHSHRDGSGSDVAGGICPSALGLTYLSVSDCGHTPLTWGVNRDACTAWDLNCESSVAWVNLCTCATGQGRAHSSVRDRGQ